MDRRCLRSPHDVEGNGLVRVAAKAFHFEIAKPGVDRVSQRGDGSAVTGVDGFGGFNGFGSGGLPK